jgi:NADP-dependent 3-hydroxy acid dehydrogenase YdfG
MILPLHTNLAGQVAVVTGASSGIGRAIAYAIAEYGATLCLIGRHQETLEVVRSELAAASFSAEAYACDLSQVRAISDLCEQLTAAHGRVDILVHCAGTISLGTIESAPIGDFDQQYQINVRAPYLLTQVLLPLVKQAQGQIVFINSSVGIRTKEQVGAYAATKHALKAIADTLRMEISNSGIRVLSVYPGNTATPMQDTVQSYTGQRIDVDYLLQPADVASAVIHALCLPRSAEITDIHIRPFKTPPR